MTAKNSSYSYKLQALATLLYRCRVISGGGPRRDHQTHHHQLPINKVGCSGYVDLGLRSINATPRPYNRSKFIMEKEPNEAVQPPLLAPTQFDSFKCYLILSLKRLLGSAFALLLLFWKKNKWDNLLRLEGTAEKFVEEIEIVAEVAAVVEEVANTAGKVSAEVANQLPDTSKLKTAAQAIEHASSLVAQDAQLIENMIHKVGDVKQDLEELEKIVEPVMEKIIQVDPAKN